MRTVTLTADTKLYKLGVWSYHHDHPDYEHNDEYFLTEELAQKRAAELNAAVLEQDREKKEKQFKARLNRDITLLNEPMVHLIRTGLAAPETIERTFEYKRPTHKLEGEAIVSYWEDAGDIFPELKEESR